MRGRLIQTFLASIARLDTTATGVAGSYDDVFGSVRKVQTGDGIGTLDRKEHAAITLPCQIGSRTWEALRAHDMGNVPDSDFIVRFHWTDLETASLVDANGRPLLHTGDRLVSILDRITEDVVLGIRTPPGLYVTEATPEGWGLCMTRPQRNLLRVKFADRPAVS